MGQSVDEATVKHLEMVQAVISRLAQNSFALKGIAATLVVGIGVFARLSLEPSAVLFALVPATVFWGLDGWYLRTEKLYRALYDAVRQGDKADVKVEPFSMDIKPFETKVDDWMTVCRSTTIRWYYGSVVATIVVIGLFT